MPRVMRIIRIISASSAVVLAAVAAILFLGMLRSVPDTLKHDKEIDQAFLRANAWVGNYKSSEGRFPSKDELAAWSATQPQSFWLKSIELIDTPDYFPNEAIKAFGQAPSGGYLLGLWRGEWNEYFASWTKTSTISDTKNVVLFVAQWLAILGLLFALSFFLWRFGRPTRSSSGPPKASLLSSAEL